MADYYIEEYTKAMRDFFGVGEPEDYIYWAYNGLGLEEAYEKGLETPIPKSQYDAIKKE